MIIFEFDYETHNSDGTLKPRPMYWLGCTSVVGLDKEHEDEIYLTGIIKTCVDNQ